MSGGPAKTKYMCELECSVDVPILNAMGTHRISKNFPGMICRVIYPVVVGHLTLLNRLIYAIYLSIVIATI